MSVLSAFAVPEKPFYDWQVKNRPGLFIRGSGGFSREKRTHGSGIFVKKSNIWLILKNACAMIKNNDKKRNDLFWERCCFSRRRSFLGQHVFREKGAAIQVLVKDEEFGTYPLSEDQEIPIGEGNILAISGGEAFMKWADCPDKLCIHQGKISHTGETIACLPNRVTVRVISGDCLKCGQHCWIRRRDEQKILRLLWGSGFAGI